MDADVSHSKPLDVASFLLSQTILFLVTIPAFLPKPVKVIGYVGVGWYTFKVILNETTGNSDLDCALGSMMIFTLLGYLDFGLLTPPESWKDNHDTDPRPVTKRPFKDRILWVLRLVSNPRGIGWAHEATHLPPRPSPSTPRFKFVISRLLTSAICLSTMAATRYFHVWYMPHMNTTSLFTETSLYRRAQGVGLYGLGVASLILFNNSITSAIAVGCGFSSPESWPPILGSPAEAWNIRRFWRRFWHQLLLRSLPTFTTSILEIISPAKYVGSTSYQLARIYIVFFLSGFGHAAGETMAAGGISLRFFKFFMLQPLGITVELLVAYIWRKINAQRDDFNSTANTNIRRNMKRSDDDNKSSGEKLPPLWIRCVGYIWVTMWIVWTGAYPAEVYRLGLYALHK